MRILVFSDSHRDVASCAEAANRIIGVDLILHAGDHAADAMELEKKFPNIPVLYVNGNCDASSAPSEIIREIDGHRILLTHGHKFRVKYEPDFETLLSYAKEKDCDCVVFGHTHVSVCASCGGITLLNPGSIKASGSYGIIEIEDGRLCADICYLSYSI